MMIPPPMMETIYIKRYIWPGKHMSSCESCVDPEALCDVRAVPAVRADPEFNLPHVTPWPRIFVYPPITFGPQIKLNFYFTRINVSFERITICSRNIQINPFFPIAD